jgi:hypothetical protein
MAAGVSVLLTIKTALKPGPAFLQRLGGLASSAQVSVYAMPRSLSLASGSGNGIVRLLHNGFARLASLAPMRRANIVAMHNRPLAALTCAEGNDLAAAAMEMGLEAVASRAAWVVGLAIV